jgi:hypothetical protein
MMTAGTFSEDTLIEQPTIALDGALTVDCTFP